MLQLIQQLSGKQHCGMRSAPMHMMAPQFAPVNSLQSDPPASSTSEDLSSAA